VKRKTNFDRYLEEHLRDPDFAERYRKAGEVWYSLVRPSNAPKARHCKRGFGELCQNTRPAPKPSKGSVGKTW